MNVCRAYSKLLVNIAEGTQAERKRWPSFAYLTAIYILMIKRGERNVRVRPVNPFLADAIYAHTSEVTHRWYG